MSYNCLNILKWTEAQLKYTYDVSLQEATPQELHEALGEAVMMAISDNWNFYLFFYFLYNIPICFSRIKLCSSSSMNCYCRSSSLFYHFCSFYCNYMIFVPTFSYFYCNWHFRIINCCFNNLSYFF